MVVYLKKFIKSSCSKSIDQTMSSDSKTPTRNNAIDFVLFLPKTIGKVFIFKTLSPSTSSMSFMISLIKVIKKEKIK
jgi:hypothetical protein